MPDTRPVWLTREQRDWIVRIGREMSDSIALAWDAAPADAVGAVLVAIVAYENRINRYHAAHAVLRALGHPEAGAS